MSDYPCPACEQTFRTAAERDQHRIDYHGWRPPQSLLSAATDVLNQLALLTRDDSSYLWRIGGRPLDESYKALKRAVADEARRAAELRDNPPG